MDRGPSKPEGPPKTEEPPEALDMVEGPGEEERPSEEPEKEEPTPELIIEEEQGEPEKNKKEPALASQMGHKIGEGGVTREPLYTPDQAARLQEEVNLESTES